jgi:hypothetical protein
VTPIRPNGLPFTPPATPPAGQGANAARSAAQKAFFDAAMGRSSAPQTPATTAPRPAAPTGFALAPQRADLRPAPGAEPPAKLLRPGSLLDIRI